MRRGLNTDDYITFGGRQYVILDSSPYKSVTCGVCTGCGTYFRGWIEDSISFESYTEIVDGRLTLQEHRTYNPNWRPIFDRFTHGEVAGVTLPYTGWLLLLNPWLSWYGWHSNALCVTDTIIELHLSSGVVDEVHDSSASAERLFEESIIESERVGKELDHNGVPDSSVVGRLARNYLVGSYHFMASEYGGVAKAEKWGYYDSNRVSEHECALCKVLLDKGIVPLKKPGTPRKRKYRVVRAPSSGCRLNISKWLWKKGPR